MEPVNKKETTKEYNKNYYEKNKEKHLKNLKQKIYCECCDKHISKVNMQKHNATKGHQLCKRIHESNDVIEKLRIVKV
jgi:hypothetical protein